MMHAYPAEMVVKSDAAAIQNDQKGIKWKLSSLFLAFALEFYV